MEGTPEQQQSNNRSSDDLPPLDHDQSHSIITDTDQIQTTSNSNNDNKLLVDVKDQLLEQTPVLYRDFWCPPLCLNLLQSSETEPNNFQPRDTDIILASKPKSGTTWLKALLFTILNRDRYPPQLVSNQHQLVLHPLLTASPHELVRSLEIRSYDETYWSEISNSPLPRLYSTHLPHHVLPEPVKTSSCKIVYLCRNPLDTIVSLWRYARTPEDTDEESLQKLEHIVDSFCNGREAYGPHWDHVSGYFQWSQRQPEKVLFMTYEEMKKDTVSGIKKLAVFMGYPFSSEEVEQGVAERIARLCSFRSMKNMEVNKTGQCHPFKPNSKFFGKGEVGDWVNQLTSSMAERVRKIMIVKFRDLGLAPASII